MWPFSKSKSVGPTEPVSFSMRERIEKMENANPIPLASDKRSAPKPEEIERIYENLLARIAKQLKAHDFDREDKCRPEVSPVETRCGATARVVAMVRDAGYVVDNNKTWITIGL